MSSYPGRAALVDALCGIANEAIAFESAAELCGGDNVVGAINKYMLAVNSLINVRKMLKILDISTDGTCSTASTAQTECSKIACRLDDRASRILTKLDQLQTRYREEASSSKGSHQANDKGAQGDCAAVEPTVMQRPITFDDVVGLDAQKKTLQRAFIAPLRYPNLYPRMSRGILFYGPPGTGKTLLAKAAVTQLNLDGEGDIGVFFYSKTAAELKGSHHGDTEKNIRNLFRCASARAKACERASGGSLRAVSILFLDEIEAIASDRSSDQSGLMGLSVTMLLQMMDGFDAPDNVAVIGATNLPWKLDSAILRRFEQKLFIGLPQSKDHFKQLVASELVAYYDSDRFTEDDKMLIADALAIVRSLGDAEFCAAARTYGLRPLSRYGLFRPSILASKPSDVQARLAEARQDRNHDGEKKALTALVKTVTDQDPTATDLALLREEAYSALVRAWNVPTSLDDCAPSEKESTCVAPISVPGKQDAVARLETLRETFDGIMSNERLDALAVDIASMNAQQKKLFSNSDITTIVRRSIEKAASTVRSVGKWYQMNRSLELELGNNLRTIVELPRLVSSASVSAPPAGGECSAGLDEDRPFDAVYYPSKQQQQQVRCVYMASSGTNVQLDASAVQGMTLFVGDVGDKTTVRVVAVSASIDLKDTRVAFGWTLPTNSAQTKGQIPLAPSAAEWLGVTEGSEISWRPFAASKWPLPELIKQIYSGNTAGNAGLHVRRLWSYFSSSGQAKNEEFATLLLSLLNSPDPQYLGSGFLTQYANAIAGDAWFRLYERLLAMVLQRWAQAHWPSSDIGQDDTANRLDGILLVAQQPMSQLPDDATELRTKHLQTIVTTMANQTSSSLNTTAKAVPVMETGSHTNASPTCDIPGYKARMVNYHISDETISAIAGEHYGAVDPKDLADLETYASGGRVHRK